MGDIDCIERSYETVAAVAELRAALSAAEAKAERYRVALDGLTAVVGLTAFKHEGQRAVLQEAFDAARAALTEGERDG